MIKLRKPKIGLALGSGAARGLAHIGVMKILEKNNIPIDFIAGSSIGALVGGLYVSGLSIEKIERLALDMTNRDMFSLVDPYFLPTKNGLIKGERIKVFIDNQIRVKNIEDCRIPFSATATDIKTGEIVVLDKGNLVDAIRASISMPLVFQPVEMDGKILVDGGVAASVPVEIVKKMGADIVIAVNLDNHYYNEDWAPGWFDIAQDSMNIMRHYLSHYESQSADIVLNLDLGSNKWYDFVNGQDKILAGEKVMEEKIPRLMEIIHSREKGGFLKRLFLLPWANRKKL
jgi:NTE family protein